MSNVTPPISVPADLPDDPVRLKALFQQREAQWQQQHVELGQQHATLQQKIIAWFNYKSSSIVMYII